MKTKIKSKKAIQWGKVIVIEELFANESSLKAVTENLKTSKPDITQDEIDQEIQNMVMKENYYNRVMDELSSAYEIEFDEEEINTRVKALKESNPNAPEENLVALSKIGFVKKLIYDDLAAQWELVVSDDMAKQTLENFYKTTGTPIREYLVDPEKFANVKATILEQMISERILNAFKGEFRLQKVAKS